MLSKEREKIIRSLQTKKGRQKSGLCLVEGKKVIAMCGDWLEYEFDRTMTENFDQLVTTETPQEAAAVARIPQWGIDDIKARPVIVVLDGVQDPGNVGAILRLCLGFGASLILVESADVSNPKVIRSSAGAMFQVPWLEVKRNALQQMISDLSRKVYRLEKTAAAQEISSIKKPAIVIAGSEGQGIISEIAGQSVFIKHSADLESLNVGQALAIVLQSLAK
ncbi:RNA methyltransferase [Patescibacteria group bacterium]|nr:RNA methyltransferase [Patescibacteria group bacterium]MBU1705169.1 RNA methyltransferase [Patescibacteria group bacterium]